MIFGKSVTSISFLIIGVCWACVFARVWTAPHPAARATVSASERQAIGRAFEKREPALDDSVRRHFPGDSWSQDDDFHALELRWAREAAAARGVSVGDILRAIDEDLRAHGADQPLRRDGAAPCKPRPFYD